MATYSVISHSLSASCLLCADFELCCRVQHPAAIMTAVILLGAGWAVPYYVPLPAYNLRKGGSYSAVLEGSVLCDPHILLSVTHT